MRTKRRTFWRDVVQQVIDNENVVDILACGHRLLAIRFGDTGRVRQFPQRECWRCRQEVKKVD